MCDSNNAELMAMKAMSQMADILNKYTVVEASNTFICDLSQRKNFEITITDTTAKTLAFSNVPVDLDFGKPVVVKVAQTASGSIGTYPSGVVWADGAAPVFTTGKTSYLTFIRAGEGWHATVLGEF